MDQQPTAQPMELTIQQKLDLDLDTRHARMVRLRLALQADAQANSELGEGEIVKVAEKFWNFVANS